LRDETGESVCLVVERGLERAVLLVIEASVELRVVPTLNSVVPVYSGASGKVIMAFKPEAERAKIIHATGLAHVTKSGQIDPSTYLENLEQVRKDGYASTSGDVTVGAAAVAAPVFGAEGALEAVVSLRGPAARMTPTRVLTLAPLVVRTADAISRELSGVKVQKTDG
jgi:DNA-binding IclR family transcriptional regulator